MEPFTPAMAAKAKSAIDYVLSRVEKHADPAEIIAGLINHHGASRRFTQGTHVLRCAGVVGSNTANSPDQLLRNWRRNAVVRLSIMI